MNVLILVTTLLLSSPVDETYAKEDLLDAMCQVESNCDSDEVGDDGDSIGAYQIQYAYWLDATEFSGIGGDYEDVLNKEYARKIVLAYWNRYATKKRLGHEPTLEDMARIHNGGPNGFKKKATVVYWTKVEKVLNNNEGE